MLLRYEYFVRILPFFKSCITGCHGNHEVSYNQKAFIFEDIFFGIKMVPMNKFTPIMKYPMCSIKV